MENVKSKRRPVPQQDDVDVAIEKMKHQWKYNPIRKGWWRWALVFIIIFMVISFFAPAWNSGGPGGVSGQIVNLAISLAIQASFAILFIYIQFFAISKPRTYWLKPYETGITFKDYKGNPQVLEMAREVVLLLKGSKDFKNMGGDVIRGLMLEGDPGVGKSYLAQAIASEAGVPFGYCSAPSLQSPFLAGGMLSIRSLYRKARKLANQYGACILFLDEIDAIGQKRNGASGGAAGGGMGAMGMMGGGGNLLINELLVQLDPPPVDERQLTKFVRWLGLDWRRAKSERPAVLTIAATNLISTLDDALLRPGRFDRKITVDKPDSEGRREVIEYYLDKVNHENIPVHRLVDETMGYSPVEIKYIINEAVVRAHFAGRDVINYQDLVYARDQHEVGLRQPIRGMTREDKRRIAYHETGHAIAQILLVPWERLVKLTIVRHGGALGFMQPKQLEEKHDYQKEEIDVKIQVSLASRASEEIFLGTGSLGFSSDLDHATSMALMMCAHNGLNGHLSSASVLGITGASYQVEIETYLEEQMKKVRQLLTANSDLVHALAAELLEREELLGDEVMEIVNQFPIKLTTDAKQKRKRIGFHFEGHEEHTTGNTGVWVEAVALAPTGTDGAPAPFRPTAAVQPNPAQTAQTATFRAVVEAPAPTSVEPVRPEAGLAAPVSYAVPTVSNIVVEPVVTPPANPVRVEPVTPPPTVYNLPPVAEPVKPVVQDDEEDDLLPRGW